MKEFFALPKQIQMREWMSFVARILESAITPFMAMYYVQYFGAFWAGLLMITTKLIGFLLGCMVDIWRIFRDVRKSLTGETLVLRVATFLCCWQICLIIFFPF